MAYHHGRAGFTRATTFSNNRLRHIEEAILKKGFPCIFSFCFVVFLSWNSMLWFCDTREGERQRKNLWQRVGRSPIWGAGQQSAGQGPQCQSTLSHKLYSGGTKYLWKKQGWSLSHKIGNRYSNAPICWPTLINPPPLSLHNFSKWFAER